MNRLTTFLGRFCVLAALIAAPWANVGADAKNFRILLYLTLASGIFAFVSLWTTPRRERRTNSYFGTLATAIPLALGLGLAVAQFLPLSDATLARVSPRVLELKAELLPPDFDEASDVPTLDAFADSEFQAPAPLDETKEAALREALSDPFSFDAEAPLDLQSATAVDAAVERAFLPADAPARNAWGRSISVYPLATRETTLIFGTALIFFLSAAFLFNSSASRRFLWSAVALNGLAVALFCLAGRANPAIFENEAVVDWLTEKRFTPFERLFVDDAGASTLETDENSLPLKGRYGMYVNKNAAGGYLVLCFAAALGPVVLAFLKTARVLDKERAGRNRERAEAERWSDVYQPRRGAFWKEKLGDFFDLFDRRFVVWSCVAGLILGAIFASLSRGASVAAFVGLLGTLIVLAFRKEGRRYWPAAVALGAVALTFVVWTGLAQRVDARMATLVEEDVETGETAVKSDSRWENWRAAAQTSRDYPWFGSGLGTYYIANYRNDEVLKFGKLFYYAENSFVQTRLEMGRVGVLLYVLTYVALFGCVGRLLVGKRSRETLAVGCVGICLIIGQFLASTGDFGIYLPANLFLFAALCGSCVARKNVRKWEKLEAALASASTRPQAVREERRATRRERGGAAVASALLLGVLLGAPWALRENADAVERTRLLDAQNEIKSSIAKVESPERPQDETFFFALPASATVDATLDDLRAFLERRDDSYKARAAAAYLEQARFRIEQFETLREAEEEATDEELWAQTAPEYWEASLRHYRRLGFD
ncbi:MAG: O-antigen ligase family protein, partial [Thermoguttaceae bacterium]|nr:O-antigen ligase family protein [Thermoguttaceae bacterium]